MKLQDFTDSQNFPWPLSSKSVAKTNIVKFSLQILFEYTHFSPSPLYLSQLSSFLFWSTLLSPNYVHSTPTSLKSSPTHSSKSHLLMYKWDHITVEPNIFNDLFYLMTNLLWCPTSLNCKFHEGRDCIYVANYWNMQCIINWTDQPNCNPVFFIVDSLQH